MAHYFSDVASIIANILNGLPVALVNLYAHCNDAHERQRVIAISKLLAENDRLHAENERLHDNLHQHER
jgi:hypothetical protein